MQFTNLTRANEIGANSYLLETQGAGFLLDCGTHPKLEGSESLPRLDLLRRKEILGVFLSHGHLDHLGALPIALTEHQDALAYMTHATSLITDRALHNSASVMMKQRVELNLPDYPLFTHSEVDDLVEDFEILPYDRPVEVDGLKVTYHEAGHVLGAAGIWIESEGKSLFYTGDVKFSDMKITRGARFPDMRPDTLVIECTRGSQASQPGFSWDLEVERLTKGILDTFAKGGSVLIPCFALGKTQEVLKLLHDLMKAGRIPEQPVFIGGLSRAYTEIYDDLASSHPRVCPGYKIEDHLNLVVLNSKEGRQMKVGSGRLMLLSSGMMTPKTMSHMMAARMAPNENHSIFFVGYVDPESPAGKLKAAGTGGTAEMGGDVGSLPIQCRVDSFDLTSHCNREHMLDYILKVKPKNTLLVHGELESLEWFRTQLVEKVPETRVIIPPSGETIDLA
jgi:Cft2 family RNA processing exonuclease